MRTMQSLVVVLLCAAAILVPRDARTVTTVNDSKNIPGSVCRVTRASYGWLDGLNPAQPRSSWPTTNNGFLSMGSTILNPPAFWNGTANTAGGDWQAACPLVNDDPSNPSGVTTATVDVEHANANPNINLNADCWLEECTAIMGNGAHGCCVGPVSHLSMGQLLTVKDFGVTVSGIPYTSCGEGTHPYVYSSVLCNLDIGTSVLGVHYSQPGGNSADW